jgi:hypothetical protein
MRRGYETKSLGFWDGQAGTGMVPAPSCNRSVPFGRIIMVGDE